MPSSDSGSPTAPSWAERLFHRITIGSGAVTETSFDLEQAMFGRAAAALALNAPVFVCGLARAGTSLVTRLLESSGSFATATYRDMPLPLAPNFWARLSGGDRRHVDAAERGHGDGLTHDLDSPEAIEEVFWRCFEAERFHRAEGLTPVQPQGQTITRYRKYVASVALRRGRARYLAKNNNNILRLPALLEAFPDAIFVHPFRHPDDQVASLLNQHVRACALQAVDPFRRAYMQWLGHHEFGSGQLPFLLPGSPEDRLARDSAAYWRKSWISVYAHLLAQPPEIRARQLFLDTDALRAEPQRFADALARALGVAGVNAFMVARKSAPAPPRADMLYDRLRGAALAA